MTTTILNLPELFEFHAVEDIHSPDWWQLRTDPEVIILIVAENERPYLVARSHNDEDGDLKALEFHGPFRTLVGAQTKAVSIARV